MAPVVHLGILIPGISRIAFAQVIRIVDPLTRSTNPFDWTC